MHLYYLFPNPYVTNFTVSPYQIYTNDYEYQNHHLNDPNQYSSSLSHQHHDFSDYLDLYNGEYY